MVMIHPERRRENLKKIEEMDRMEKIIKGIEECDLNGGLIGNCPYKGILVLLKEQDELLRKLQKDKDKLCLEVSEWKHKYHDGSLKEQEAKPDKCIICERCGHKLQDDWNYCPWCRWETARGRRGERKMKEYIVKVDCAYTNGVQELVRCKDCKKRETMYCPFYWHYKGTKYDDWFCADGKKRDNNDG